jgi:hypothetical protein
MLKKLIGFFILSITASIMNLSFADPIIIADGKSNIDYSGWSAYATSLDTCSPNTYNLPDPFAINMLMAALQAIQSQNGSQKASSSQVQAIGNAIAHSVITYTIYGWNQNKCLVNIVRTFTPPLGASNSAQPITIGMNCEFSQSDLGVLAQNAQQIASGKLDMDSQSPAGQIMQQSCTAQQASS